MSSSVAAAAAAATAASFKKHVLLKTTRHATEILIPKRDYAAVVVLPTSSTIKLARTTTSKSSIASNSSMVRVWPQQFNSVVSQRRYFQSSTRNLHADNTNYDLRNYFHIEASNANRPDATALTVTGPDVDGMVASMTIALATRGCSLVELHAAKDEDVSFDRIHTHNVNKIRDVFYVVRRTTGNQFDDDELEDLAFNVLESLRSPMALVSGFVGTEGGGADNNKTEDHLQERLQGMEPYSSIQHQIEIIPSVLSVKNK